MSADNGIYILKCKDQSRVLYTQCIENLWYSHLKDREDNFSELVPTRIIEYFGKGRTDILTHEEAIQKAHRMYDDFMENDDYGILEYGISTISINKTWDEILSEAKEMGIEEIRKLISLDNWTFYIDDIIELFELYDEYYDNM